MNVDAIWRYPVKSLAGEQVQRAEITLDNGMVGDRLVHVRGPEGVRTSRKQHRLLGLKGSLDAHGEPLIDGYAWNDPIALELVQAAAGADAVLASYRGPERFDVLPLLVLTDGALAAFGRDVRRLRPNVVIGGVEGTEEFSWEGAQLHIGDVVIGLHSRRGRCPMTTVDPNSLEKDVNVLKDIYQRFDGQLALNAFAIVPGVINVGDEVRLVRP
jgi:uncharacterized protein